MSTTHRDGKTAPNVSDGIQSDGGWSALQGPPSLMERLEERILLSTTIDLLSASDTGVSDSDDITSLTTVNVDVATDEVIVEISGQEQKIESFIDLMRPFEIVELVRTGRIAMVRGLKKTAQPPAPKST